MNSCPTSRWAPHTITPLSPTCQGEGQRRIRGLGLSSAPIYVGARVDTDRLSTGGQSRTFGCLEHHWCRVCTPCVSSNTLRLKAKSEPVATLHQNLETQAYNKHFVAMLSVSWDVALLHSIFYCCLSIFCLHFANAMCYASYCPARVTTNGCTLTTGPEIVGFVVLC